MATIRLPNDWKPRAYQLPAWTYLEKGGKRACLVWHRRAGKDDVALNWAAVVSHLRVGTYWHMLPEASQARKAVWEAVDPHRAKRRIDLAFPRALRETTRENEMMIKFRNGSTWQVVGSDNYDSLVGSPPVGVVFSEWALAKPEAWAYIRPILAENDGWAMFIYTSRGPGLGKRTYDTLKADPTAYAEILSADKTGVFSADQLASERAAYLQDYGTDEGANLFDQEYMCSFEGAMLGAFYAGELRQAREERRICKVVHDPYADVFTAWDLGYTDSTAIWFGQVVGTEIRFIDYYEDNSRPLLHYADVLKEKAAKRGFRYGKHYFPHDVQAHELTAGQSRVATLRQLGITPIATERHNPLDGINAVRRIFHRMWFDDELCARGLDALTNYRRERDETLKVFKPRPLHDWSSHGADAMRTFAAGFVPEPISTRYKREAKPIVESWMTA